MSDPKQDSNLPGGSVLSRSGGANSPGHEPASAIVDGDPHEGRPKAPPIVSVEQLLQVVYDAKPRRLVLKKSQRKAMRKDSELDDRMKEDIFRQALSVDRTLERTRELMFLCVEIESTEVAIARRLRSFSGDFLYQHPAFKDRSLAGILKDLPEGATEDAGIRTLASQDYALLSWPEGGRLKTKRDMEQCRKNSIYCLLLWFRMTRKMSIERIHYHLQEHLWKPADKPNKPEVDELRALMNARDLGTVSMACSLLEKQALQQGQRADRAIRAEDRAVARLEELKRDLKESKDRLEMSREEESRLGNELQREKQAHHDDVSHRIDDYEKLRGRVLHRLREELRLLDDGLHALKRDPPKVHVMIDHAERAIDGLKQEADRLGRGS